MVCKTKCNMGSQGPLTTTRPSPIKYSSSQANQRAPNSHFKSLSHSHTLLQWKIFIRIWEITSGDAEEINRWKGSLTFKPRRPEKHLPVWIWAVRSTSTRILSISAVRSTLPPPAPQRRRVRPPHLRTWSGMFKPPSNATAPSVY